MTTLLAATLLSCLLPGDVTDVVRKQVLDSIEARRERYVQLAREIWQHPELGYLEQQSSALLAAELEANGFKVERGVAGIPTAFVASFGSGRPVVAVLGEYDALPGMSQAALPEQKALAAGAPGHACGHNLFGPGALAAAVAARQWLESTKSPGTVRFYGTPAEEGGGGKLYMLREGLFSDVDVALAWHPADRNDPSDASMIAAINANFRFRGVAAHAAMAPERGRSALDAVEAMNFMVNLMREHVPAQTRIHYIITQGGKAPNIVPDVAASSYIVRHPDLAELERIWERVLDAARGAALGTGTSMEFELESFYYPILGNDCLSELQRANFERVGGVEYSPEEQAFAEAIARTLPPGGLPLGSQRALAPSDYEPGRASSDVGDVSWNVPTGHMSIATWVPGTAAHTWQAVAAGGTSIGEKGMLVAAKTLALTMIDLFDEPALVREAREEFDRRRGSSRWTWRLGDRTPPLDYRRK